MLPEDLKDYRAPRNLWPLILAVSVVIAALTFVGPVDLAWQYELEAKNKVLRAEVAALRKPQAQLAPIRPYRRCGEKPFIAWQAAGGMWKAHCTPEADMRGGK